MIKIFDSILAPEDVLFIHVKLSTTLILFILYSFKRKDNINPIKN